jgi:hypothetical protein
MIPNKKYSNQSLEFWANIKLISQKVGYTERGTSKIKTPTIQEIINAYDRLGLDVSRMVKSGKLTKFGKDTIGYFEYRADMLNNFVEPRLMKKDEAQKLFEELQILHTPSCPIPMNKQKGDKKAPAYFTGMINILIEANLEGAGCDFDPKSLISFTDKKFPIRSLSRRVDGAFPSTINPISIWEIKEYYYTTTFGSRVADGVYETLLDGYELDEIRKFTKTDVRHYLMVDDYFTWWKMGRSYLCRICDMLHMGLLTEAIFGREIIERIPIIVKEWTKILADKGT